jgi:SPP1 gp7 family putative phage head morphogenesis protein
MSTNDVIEDSLTRHQIFVLRYGAGREKEAQKAIAKSLGAIIKQIKELDLMGLPPDKLLEQSQYLYRYLIEANSEYVDEFMDEMHRFSQSEVRFNTKTMSGKVGVGFNVPSDMQLEQAVFGNFGNMEPAKGKNIQALMNQFGVENADLVEQQIRDSILLGENTNDLVNKITNIEPLQKRKASTLARTVTNQVSNQTRTETMKANEDVLEGYEWVATLDSRTTIICASRDGNVYTNYDTDPKPPAHFNCRSTITFKVDPKYDLGKDLKGTRPAKGSGGKQNVNNETNYSQWLRKQSKEFQEEVLGKNKAKIFRDGLPLDRFIDENGKPLSLKALENMDELFNSVTL